MIRMVKVGVLELGEALKDELRLLPVLNMRKGDSRPDVLWVPAGMDR